MIFDGAGEAGSPTSAAFALVGVKFSPRGLSFPTLSATTPLRLQQLLSCIGYFEVHHRLHCIVGNVCTEAHDSAAVDEECWRAGDTKFLAQRLRIRYPLRRLRLGDASRNGIRVAARILHVTFPHLIDV